MHVSVSLGGHLLLLRVLCGVFVAHSLLLLKTVRRVPTAALELALFPLLLSTVLIGSLSGSLLVEQPGEMLRHRRYLPPLDADLSLLILLHDEVYLTQFVVRPVVVQPPLRPTSLRTLEGRAQYDLGDLSKVPDVLCGVPSRVEERRAVGL